MGLMRRNTYGFIVQTRKNKADFSFFFLSFFDRCVSSFWARRYQAAPRCAGLGGAAAARCVNQRLPEELPSRPQRRQRLLLQIPVPAHAPALPHRLHILRQRFPPSRLLRPARGGGISVGEPAADPARLAQMFVWI